MHEIPLKLPDQSTKNIFLATLGFISNSLETAVLAMGRNCSLHMQISSNTYGVKLSILSFTIT